MTVSKEMLMVYVDGELPSDDMRRIDEAIAADPALRAYVEEQQSLRRSLHDAFDPLLAAPVPDALLAATAARPSWRWRIRQGWSGAGLRRALLWSGLPAGAALAAGLVLGLFLGGPGADIVSGPGGLTAQGNLAAALTHGLASEPVRSAEAQIGISFKDKAGAYCRTFSLPGAAGVACRRQGGWHIAALAQTQKETGAGAAYRPAASGMPDAVRSAVSGLIAGAPLDAAGERQARAAGWTDH